MPGRKYNAGSGYRYGFNGKENDKDISEGGQDYGMRIYDGRLGRFLSVDPYGTGYPYYSSYQFSGNTPIQAIDLDGGEPIGYSTSASFKHPGNEWLRKSTDVKVISNVYGNWYKMQIRDGAGKDWIVFRQETTEIETIGSFNKVVAKVDFYYLDNNCNAPAHGQNWLTNPDGSFAGNLIEFDAQERLDMKNGSAFADAVGTTVFIAAAGIAAAEAGIGLGTIYRTERIVEKIREKESNSGTDPASNSRTEKDPANSISKSEKYSNAGNKSGKGDKLRGGKQSKRDSEIMQYPKDFRRWYHREYKEPGDPNATPEELKELFKEWNQMGKPGKSI